MYKVLLLMRMAGLMRGQGSVSSLKYLAIADRGSPAATVAPAVVVAEEPFPANSAFAPLIPFSRPSTISDASNIPLLLSPSTPSLPSPDAIEVTALSARRVARFSYLSWFFRVSALRTSSEMVTLFILATVPSRVVSSTTIASPIALTSTAVTAAPSVTSIPPSSPSPSSFMLIYTTFPVSSMYPKKSPLSARTASIRPLFAPSSSSLSDASSSESLSASEEESSPSSPSSSALVAFFTRRASFFSPLLSFAFFCFKPSLYHRFLSRSNAKRSL
mmetsp:Transcript_48045/g.84196  ORF Transcript_48045/g.84196 Transcript_48045/m.84196 type:complete len:274 (+) Transcript_48045:552-1373(+)